MAIVCRGKDAPPPTLREALLRRGFVVEEVGTTYAAIGRAVLVSRQDAKGRAIVVLVEPTTLSRPHELVAVLANTAPNAKCWVCQRAGSGIELRAATEVDIQAWQTSGKSAEAAVVSVAGGGASVRPLPRPANEVAARTYEDKGASPSLRLAGDWQGGAADVPKNGPSEASPPVLTDEELAMLLGDETSAEPET